MSFQVDGTSVYLFGVASDVGLTGTSIEATIGELVDSMSPEQPKKKKQYTNNVVSSNLFHPSITPSSNSYNLKNK